MNFREDLFSRNRPDTVSNKSQMDLKRMKISREKENFRELRLSKNFVRIYFRELRLSK